MSATTTAPTPVAAEPPASSRAQRLLFLAFFLLTSLAEGAQAVVVLWLTYDLTDSALLIGVMIVLGYLPAAVVGMLYRVRADRDRADRVARRTNTVLSVASLVLALQQAVSGASVALSIAAIALAQVVLSLAKMLNKAALSRLIRHSFESWRAKRFLETSSSASLVGQVAGAGLAGLVLAQGWVVEGLLFAAVAYAASAVCLVLGTSGYAERARIADAEEAAGSGATGGAPPPPRRLQLDPGLVAILVYSTPSSGGLQFLTTLLVPLAAFVAPHQPSFYAVLTIATSCGGFLAGIVLSTNLVSMRVVLRGGLPIVAVLAVALSLTRATVLVAALSFALALVITCHVICMQVLTNQVPEEDAVGQFAIVRNVAASLTKAVFAFSAGALIGVFGVATASRVLAVATAGFAIAFLVTRPSWRISDEEVA
jgi:MFS family permease